MKKINSILCKNRNQSIEVMDRGTLKELLRLYKEIEAHHECNKIERVLDKFKEESQVRLSDRLNLE